MNTYYPRYAPRGSPEHSPVDGKAAFNVTPWPSEPWGNTSQTAEVRRHDVWRHIHA
ncbi:Hypothetical protein FKW44_003569 [Caligus rogercresseyi]|uniref:Uncharacterized protein n=1 Tax=Caligus rogercresseyi TaxID=217165 RepID=A0A7T8KLX4_CALRO|nr:Hypothetical protein FKW44_003569 [Caligus rogercresseyi]